MEEKWVFLRSCGPDSAWMRWLRWLPRNVIVRGDRSAGGGWRVDNPYRHADMQTCTVYDHFRGANAPFFIIIVFRARHTAYSTLAFQKVSPIYQGNLLGGRFILEDPLHGGVRRKS